MKNTISLRQLLLAGLFMSISVFANLYAADYTITFTASGAATTISAVEVQNMTQNTTLTVPAGAPVTLTVSTAAPHLAANSQNLKIYPNPITEKSTVSFYSELGGKADIAVYGMDGRTIIRTTQNLAAGTNQFKLSLPQGVFSLHINENAILHFGTVISQTMHKADLEFAGAEPAAAKPMQKVKASTTALGYNAGDQLLFKGYSGDLCTVVTLKPTCNTVVNFNFVECRDADGYNYPVVQIGDQVWMAENLKTTRYRNGDPIPNVTDKSAWMGLTNGAFCDYSNDSANGVKYGHLYNWFTVSDSRMIAPTGWHVPTDLEWTTIENYLITNGYNYDSSTTGNKIAKSLAANTYWTTSYFIGEVGNDLKKNNKSGFTALPGGFRDEDGIFYFIRDIGLWWGSSTKNTESTNISLYNSNVDLNKNTSNKNSGFSVRCIMEYNTNPFNIVTSSIPTGTFTMGSPITEVFRYSDEIQHTVTLSAYRMSKYEITNSQYAAFLNAEGIGSNGLYGSGKYPTEPLIYTNVSWGLIYSSSKWVPVTGYENNPLVNVTWYGATEYASYVGGGLPTEAQWEYACRGGTTTPFNTGDCLTNTQANYDWEMTYSGCANSDTIYPGKTQPVGLYAPNGYGLYDMHGNVEEWCADRFDIYPSSPQINPTGGSGGLYRVTRGGGWGNWAEDCRSAIRYSHFQTSSRYDLGFRVVFDP